MSLIERSVDHQYTYERVTYPGVTAQLKVIDKSDALMAWAARMTAEAAVGLIDQLPSMLSQIGAEGVVKALSSRSAWKRDEAALQGTELHAMADLLHQGQPLPEVSEAVRQRVEHYAKWWDTSGWTIRASEACLVNTRLGYGGTLDVLAYDRDQRTVLADVKGGRGVYREVFLQLASYGNAEWLEVKGQLYPMPTIDRYVVLHVTTAGVREIELSIGEAELAAFAAAMTLSAWRESVKGRL